MRRRKKRRRRNKNNKEDLTANSTQQEFEKTNQNNQIRNETNHTNPNKSVDGTLKLSLPVNLHKENVGTQTILFAIDHDSVLKIRKDFGIQFPEQVTTNPKSKTELPKVLKQRPFAFSYNAKRRIHHLCRSCSYRLANRHTPLYLHNKDKGSPLHTKIGTLVRTIYGVANILKRLRNHTLAVSALLLNGFISIGKLVNICLDLELPVRRVNNNAKSEQEQRNKNFEQNNISKEMDRLKQLILDEFSSINRRLDGIESIQTHIEKLVQATKEKSSASEAICTAFVPPPPPPMPLAPPKTVQYKRTSSNHVAIDNDTKKRSLSDINVCNSRNSNNERITITVEDLRNVKLRSRSRKEVGVTEQKQPYISEQMLNGIKLRPTSGGHAAVKLTIPDSSKSMSAAIPAPSMRSMWKYNTL